MDFRRKNIDIVGKMWLWFTISSVLLAVGLTSWAAFGLNLGIDFKGGGQFQYRIPAEQRPTAAGQDVALLGKVRGALETQGLRTLPQIAGGDTLVIKTDARGQGELRGQQLRIEKALAPIFAGSNKAALTPLGQEFVGPVIGEELKRNAILGVIFGVSLIALWIYIRYNFAGDGARYAVAGITALVHDVLVLLGIFALIGKIDPRVEIDGAFIAALLTVVGYSINDSVVIFDRLRENLRVRRKEPFEKVVNDSLLETMSRSINTGLTVVIMLFTLLWFGGESIYNFVLAMLIGIASGLYSSIFNASMVVVAWNRWDEKKASRSRMARASAITNQSAARTPQLATATSSTRNTRIAPPASNAPRRASFAKPATVIAPDSSQVSVAPNEPSNDRFAAPISVALSSTDDNVATENLNATQILVEQDGGATGNLAAELSEDSAPSDTAPTDSPDYFSTDAQIENGESEDAASDSFDNSAANAASRSQRNTKKARAKRRH